MKTTISKLTKKYQATVPEAIRKKLHLNAGDVIAFDIDGDEIKIRKAKPMDIEFHSRSGPHFE